MPAEIKVTVICPIRNEAGYIRDCLNSLLDQTYPAEKTEILVIDGMSDDGTRDIVAEISAKDTRVRLLDNPARIVPCALNIGIRQAHGQYLVRLDGHASAAPDFIENNVRALDGGEARCVGGPIISVNLTGTGKAIAAAMSSPFGVGNAHFRTSTTRRCFVDTVAFPGFQRSLFDEIGLFDEEMVRCQDDEFNFRIRSHGGKILLTPDIKSWYYPRAGFKKLWRQYFGYGLWKIRVFQKHPTRMKLRHFVPAIFVLALIVPIIMGLFYGPLLSAAAAVLTVYVTASILAGLRAGRKNPEITIPGILLSFYILHLSYGLGFWWGMIRFFPKWWQKNIPETTGMEIPSARVQ